MDELDEALAAVSQFGRDDHELALSEPGATTMGRSVNDMRLVMIEWEDSHADALWHTLGAPIEDRALLCRSVGWLVLDGERAKVLAPHINEAEPGVPLQGCGIMTIPRRSVVRIIDLAWPR